MDVSHRDQTACMVTTPSVSMTPVVPQHSNCKRELTSGKVAVVSLRYNPAHLSHLTGFGKAFRELGYEVEYLLNPLYARFPELSVFAPVLPCQRGFSGGPYSHAVFVNVSAQNRSVATLLKQRGTRVLYVYHEPWKYSFDYLEGEGLKGWLSGALAHQVSKAMLKVSDAVILPSRYGAQIYAQGDIRHNRNAHVVPIMYDDECDGALFEGPVRKYFSYIGSICRAHGFDQYVAFMKYALARKLKLDFMIASKCPLPEYVLKDELIRGNLHRINIVCGRTLTSEEINKCYAESFCVWNLYRRSTQSGVLVKSFMFGAPVIASRTGSFIEFIRDGFNGRFASAEDLKGIASALEDIRENIAEYAAECRNTFLETFFYRANLSELERLLVH